jgi:DNA-binding transcriptional LysR family regulator
MNRPWREKRRWRALAFAYMREAWLAQDVAAGRLVSVLNEWMPSSPGLCLYYPGRRNVPASLRAFIDVIREIEPPADDELTGPARGVGSE